MKSPLVQSPQKRKRLPERPQEVAEVAPALRGMNFITAARLSRVAGRQQQQQRGCDGDGEAGGSGEALRRMRVADSREE